MKRYILSIGLLCFAAFGLQSCLDIDDPGDERGANEMELDGERNQGNADKIDFVKFASTPEMFDKVAAGLKQNLAQFVTGQYTMCGGKEGDMPSEHPYQRQFNLGPDNYVQYFTIPHKDFMYGTLTSTYNISNEFCGGELYGYTGAKNAYVPLLNHPLIDSIPEMKATALLYLSFIAQGAADLSGPMTYFEDKQNLEHPATYVSVERIYKNIVDNLNTIIQTYEAYETRPAWYQQKLKKLIEKNCQYFSMTSNKEVSELKKVANSLKLRMAMNITKVDPTLAKQWGEEAVASGVIEELSEQQAFYPMTQGKVHPLVTISETWGDTRLSASFESMLKSLNHPYLDYLFKPTSAKIGDLEPNQEIVGLRSGLKVGNGQTNPPNIAVAFSRLVRDEIMFAPIYVLKLAEVEFLRAEGALRGWNMGGTAQEFYEKGIRHADLADPLMGSTKYSSKLEEYMALEQAVPFVQKNPLGNMYSGDGSDWPSVTKIGVKWNEGDSKETKLEKIITQKYIAIFPSSWVAWTDLRRTGYPKLFPVLNTFDGDGSIRQGEMLRRIPWQMTDPQVAKNINETGIPALGGENLQATRLWWDVDAPNF